MRARLTYVRQRELTHATRSKPMRGARVRVAGSRGNMTCLWLSATAGTVRHPVVYLHGFGQKTPRDCRVLAALRTSLPAGHDPDVLLPSYHPNGTIKQTALEPFLDNLFHSILARKAQVHLVGYSVGGWLVAIFAERHPQLVASTLLLAPAIDNYERNFDGVSAEDCHMPPTYVAEVQRLPPRPQIDTRLVPTAIVHGQDDTDRGGSPWRVAEWTADAWAKDNTDGRRCAVYMPPGVDHSLEPWLSSNSSGKSPVGTPPPLRTLLASLHT
jgi:pimeloyl-ACP methyl ester carboxylesterase